MIRELKGKGRLLFVSREFLNSIVRWICGVHSPDGSVIVRNTSDPKAGGASLGLSVNIPAVASRVRKTIFGEERPTTRNDVKEIVRNSADGNSIKGDGSHLSVSAEWLKRMMSTLSQDDLGGATACDDRTDTNGNDGTAGLKWSWERGRNALVFSCYCEIGIDDDGYHDMAHVNITISPDGRILKAVATGETKKVYA